MRKIICIFNVLVGLLVFSGIPAVADDAEISRNAISRNVIAQRIQQKLNNNDAAEKALENAEIEKSDTKSKDSQTKSVQVSRTAVYRTASPAGSENSATTNIQRAVTTVGRSARSEAASINSSAPVRRAGVSLRPSTAEVGGRATISGTQVMTGSNVDSGKSVAPRTARAGTAQETLDSLKSTAEATSSCQQQYTECLDQFCNTIDANQKRCSCSSRLSNYSKVESAVKDANTQLNEVAQRIRYVGLSADEIRSIMTATEAEIELQGATDNTESRDMLEEIEKLIKQPGTFVSESGTGSSFDAGDLDFSSSDSGDMFNLDSIFGSGTSFSNMRGTELYNAAKNKCKTILNSCKQAGINTSQITARYDMEIDKDCISYEKGLNKMNDTLKTNVRSATGMLQKARLAVLQNQNTYDSKGCINALDQCMTDEMVCGDDYFKCIDPTKTYIDENGEVMLGKDVTTIRNMMSTFNNASINSTLLQNSMTMVINDANCTGPSGNNGACVIKYLLNKIGTGDVNTGLCRAVLDKCRNVTYDDNSTYLPYNEIVVNYVQRAMTNIKAAQENIISEYASSCMTDIATCYNSQVSQVSGWSSNASTTNVLNVMTGACRNVALTCAYAVFAGDATGLCSNTTNCINNISQIFYQQLLCPKNSDYIADVSTTTGIQEGIAGVVQVTGTGISASYVNRFWANSKCLCASGYAYSSGQCVTCPTDSSFDVTSTQIINGAKGCHCDTGYDLVSGYCIAHTAP